MTHARLIQAAAAAYAAYAAKKAALKEMADIVRRELPVPLTQAKRKDW